MKIWKWFCVWYMAFWGTWMFKNSFCKLCHRKLWEKKCRSRWWYESLYVDEEFMKIKSKVLVGILEQIVVVCLMHSVICFFIFMLSIFAIALNVLSNLTAIFWVRTWNSLNEFWSIYFIFRKSSIFLFCVHMFY